jgi:hypothetical protein
LTDYLDSWHSNGKQSKCLKNLPNGDSTVGEENQGFEKLSERK